MHFLDYYFLNAYKNHLQRTSGENRDFVRKTLTTDKNLDVLLENMELCWKIMDLHKYVVSHINTLKKV